MTDADDDNDDKSDWAINLLDDFHITIKTLLN